MIAKTSLNAPAILVGCLIGSSVSLAKPAGVFTTSLATVALGTPTVAASYATKTVCVFGTAPAISVPTSSGWSWKAFTVPETSSYHVTTMVVYYPPPLSAPSPATAFTVSLSHSPWWSEIPIRSSYSNPPPTPSPLNPVTVPISESPYSTTHSWSSATHSSSSYSVPTAVTVPMSESPGYTVIPVSRLPTASASPNSSPTWSYGGGPPTASAVATTSLPAVYPATVSLYRTTIVEGPVATTVAYPAPSQTLADGTFCDYVEVNGVILPPSEATTIAAQKLSAETTGESNGAMSTGAKFSVVSTIAGGVFGVVVALL